MKVLRTPDDRFVDLPGYAFTPRYVEVDDTEGGSLRMHYVDAGPSSASPVLLLHGEPTWSYLYRTMLPVLTSAGHRVVAPDLIGFGRSDKPASPDDYTYARHVDWTAALLDALELTDITLFCQDWGGLIGLRMLADAPDRFVRVVAANTGLPIAHRPPLEAFLAWQRFSQESAAFDVGRVIQNGTTTDLPAEVVAAYDAPFPDDRYKAGARIFPSLVPTRPDDPGVAENKAAWEVLKTWSRPFLTAFSDQDPITAGGYRPFQKLVPGAEGRQHPTIEGAGHFLQEDRGEQLGSIVAEFIAATPS